LGTAPSAEQDTTNTKAYEYYLRGRGYAVSKSDRDIELAELVPERAESHLARAFALMANKKFAEVEAGFKKTIELDPSLCSALHHLARVQLHQGKTRDAADSFSTASQCDVDDYESPILGAAVYEGMGEVEEAQQLARVGVERAERILEDYPDNQRAYYLGAGGYATLRDVDADCIYAVIVRIASIVAVQ